MTEYQSFSGQIHFSAWPDAEMMKRLQEFGDEWGHPANAEPFKCPSVEECDIAESTLPDGTVSVEIYGNDESFQAEAFMEWLNIFNPIVLDGMIFLQNDGEDGDNTSAKIYFRCGMWCYKNAQTLYGNTGSTEPVCALIDGMIQRVPFFNTLEDYLEVIDEDTHKPAESRRTETVFVIGVSNYIEYDRVTEQFYRISNDGVEHMSIVYQLECNPEDFTGQPVPMLFANADIAFAHKDPDTKMLRIIWARADNGKGIKSHNAIEDALNG